MTRRNIQTTPVVSALVAIRAAHNKLRLRTVDLVPAAPYASTRVAGQRGCEIVHECTGRISSPPGGTVFARRRSNGFSESSQNGFKSASSTKQPETSRWAL